MRSLLLFFLCLVNASVASGHARLLPGGSTPGRSNSAGLKTGPCGEVAKGSPVATFNVGQKITVQWEETINHPGYFEFSISSNGDQSFQLLLTVPDNLNSTDDLPHRYQAEIQLPAGLSCDNCTLQMIQQMTENPSNPRPYFSCSDITIKTKDGDTPTPPIDEDKNSIPENAEDCN